jgi:hypothetical protein|tara:strand:- start:174 stop:494 length:321 start_codon:yes stop_codon:yes gene_type:complete
MEIDDLNQEDLIEKLGKFEDLVKLQNQPEFDTLLFYFRVVADRALKELVLKEGLSQEKQAELKAIIKVCKYEFEALPSWLKNQALLAKQELDFRREHGVLELENKT